MAYRYLAFGEPLDCEFPLPELSARVESGGGKSRLQVTWCPSEGIDLGGYATVCEWASRGGRPYCRLNRKGDSFCLEFPGYAAYLMQPEGRIACQMQKGCEPQLFRHFLLNQAVPRFLGHQGSLVLHAAAISLSDGRGIVMCGPSGRGKSTLASAFLRAGHELIADDCVLIRFERPLPTIHGALAGVRLRAADVEKQLLPDHGFDAPDAYSGKRRAAPNHGRHGASGAGAPLAAIFLIDPANEQIRIHREQGARSLVALLDFAYCLDPSSESVSVRSFRAVGGVLEGGIPVFRLAYPRSIDRLPEVVEVVSRTTSDIRG